MPRECNVLQKNVMAVLLGCMNVTTSGSRGISKQHPDVGVMGVLCGDGAAVLACVTPLERWSVRWLGTQGYGIIGCGVKVEPRMTEYQKKKIYTEGRRKTHGS